jgi:tetratricopeptide (TPR) repeat protein
VEKTTADPLVGKTVAQYEVVARLGGGGMGVVYSARDTKLGRRVALKFLPPRWSHDDSAKQRFVREAQAASATDHRNICTIHDIETADDGQLFIVMAHYEGETLKQRLERGPLPIDEAIEIAAQVAEGLAKAHAQGVVHRDIKPGNLMLTEDGVKILDFGLAKLAAEALKLTLEGSTLGTVAYMSPEQARGDEADARSDVWALGVVLYEMLAGEPPFKGPYAEAITHAIRSQEPAPLAMFGRDIPDYLDRLVARTLAKNTGERVQSARELARALRMLQGRTIPLDLRTEPVVVESRARAATVAWWKRPRTIVTAAALIVLLAGAPLWLFAPVRRLPIAVAPLVNRTGYPELDGYRLALTNELTAQLIDSRTIRVLPFDRVAEIIRLFRGGGRDISSRDALQALTMQGGAQIVVVPTLLYEATGWKARVELRDADTATNVATYETEPVVSSLPKDAAYGLMLAASARVHEHFRTQGSRRTYVAETIRALVRSAPAPAKKMRTLDAAAAFAAGVDAYEQQEYDAALRSLVAASEQDPRNPLLYAWRSHVAQLMRRDSEAAEAAEQATRLLTDLTPPVDRLFIEAVAAEARRDYPASDARYAELLEWFPNDPAWISARAGLQDRRTLTAEAAVSYVNALRLDERMPRPQLELCRLYGPNRLNESAKAKEHGRLALARYRALGDRPGEAQALLCLTDTLRTGNQQERQDARVNAETALKILQDGGSTYQLARAYYYVALVAGVEGRLTDAMTLGEQSLAISRKAGNVILEPLVLMNLGVASNLLGKRAPAVDYYHQSAALFESLGDNQRAAQTQANAGAIVIEYGGDRESAVRDVQNALSVFRNLGNSQFEVFCLRLLGGYYRNAGQYRQAAIEFNRALALVGERGLDQNRAPLTNDLATVRFEQGDYVEAHQLFLRAIGEGVGPNSIRPRLRLAQVNARLGDLTAASAALTQASMELEKSRDTSLLSLRSLVAGEVAYEAGRLEEARTHFTRSAALWIDDTPDPSSVEARAYIGLLDAVSRRGDSGRRALRESLEQSHKMARFALVARTHLFLARAEVARSNFAEALAALSQIPTDDPSRISAELRGQVHYWRAVALRGRGDDVTARTEADSARKILADFREKLPSAYQAHFAARRDISAIGQ